MLVAPSENVLWAYADSEGPDQTAHPRWKCTSGICGQRRPWSDCASALKICFGQMRIAKALIRLRMRAVWSGPLLSAYRIAGYCRINVSMYSRCSDQIVQLHWLTLTFTVRIWHEDCISYVAAIIRLIVPISLKTHSLYAVCILSSGKAVNQIDLHPFLRKAKRKLLQRASKWFKLLSWCFVIYTASLLSRNASNTTVKCSKRGCFNKYPCSWTQNQ